MAKCQRFCRAVAGVSSVIILTACGSSRPGAAQTGRIASRGVGCQYLYPVTLRRTSRSRREPIAFGTSRRALEFVTSRAATRVRKSIDARKQPAGVSRPRRAGRATAVGAIMAGLIDAIRERLAQAAGTCPSDVVLIERHYLVALLQLLAHADCVERRGALELDAASYTAQYAGRDLGLTKDMFLTLYAIASK